MVNARAHKRNVIIVKRLSNGVYNKCQLKYSILLQLSKSRVPNRARQIGFAKNTFGFSLRVLYNNIFVNVCKYIIFQMYDCIETSYYYHNY